VGRVLGGSGPSSYADGDRGGAVVAGLDDGAEVVPVSALADEPGLGRERERSHSLTRFPIGSGGFVTDGDVGGEAPSPAVFGSSPRGAGGASVDVAGDEGGSPTADGGATLSLDTSALVASCPLDVGGAATSPGERGPSLANLTTSTRPTIAVSTTRRSSRWWAELLSSDSIVTPRSRGHRHAGNPLRKVF
jgi:hypothetical protein